VRHSDFWRLVDEEFGPGYGRTLVRDQVLGDLNHRTAEQALADGEAPRTVWFALCVEMAVPEERRWGRDEQAGQKPGQKAGPSAPGRATRRRTG
jgi:hypothetical protein